MTVSNNTGNNNSENANQHMLKKENTKDAGTYVKYKQLSL